MIKVCILGMLPDGAPNENQRYWLAGDPLDTEGSTALDGEQRQVSRKSQDESGNGFPFVVPHDTGNEKLTMSFSTTRTHDTIIDAWRWRNGFSSQDPANWPHPIEGDCLMRFELEDGTFEDVRLYDCLISKPASRPEGLSQQVNYSLQGGRIESYAVGENAIPMADADAFDAPQVGLFLTSVGGTPLLDDADTWSSALEANNGWWLQVGAADVRSTPSGITQNFYFGVAGVGLANGLPSPVIDMLPPMKDRLAAIGAALDPTWFSYTLETVGGRSMLRIKNIRSTDYVGGLYPPVLDVTVYTFWPQTPTTVAYKHSTGETASFTDVLPFDDAGDIPVADDDVG
ncbi:MAG: hypothetical protein V4662_24945 [Verrucomicrobiota bacterium]